MFSSGPNYTKLKTNLRLSVNRLKLLEKKKSELVQKSRREIAEYIADGKFERAKIRVEHIIREDYLVEAMEIVEMYCDLLLARFGLITQMKDLDDGIAEAVASIVWVTPRLQADVQELKVITDIFTVKFGKPFADSCRAESENAVSSKLKHKLSIQSPPKILVEKYIIEIAKSYNIDYEPDPNVMREESDGILVDLSDRNNLGTPQPLGFIGYPQPPVLPTQMPFMYPSTNINDPNNKGGGSNGGGGGGASFVLPDANNANNIPYGAPFSYNIPPGTSENKETNTAFGEFGQPTLPNVISPDDNNLQQKDEPPKPAPRAKIGNDAFPDVPELPSVPSDSPSAPKSDLDFDDLTKRFEALKKKK